MPVTNDSWVRGNPYDQFMGRWSRLVGIQFLHWVAAPAQKSWLDLGCGTGVLTQLILQNTEPLHVTAIDQSEAFIANIRQELTDPRLSARAGNALFLDLPSRSVDLTVSALAFNFFPDFDLALQQMIKVTRPGGTVAFYVWDYAGEMQMLRYFWDAAIELDPDASALDEGVRFPICAPKPLTRLFQNNNLADIIVNAIDAVPSFQNFDDYWSPFLGAVGPAPSYVSDLDPEMRSKLKQTLRNSLPIQPDGSLQLRTRAWAVRGKVN